MSQQLRTVMQTACTPDHDGYLDPTKCPFHSWGWLGTVYWMVHVDTPQVAAAVHDIDIDKWDTIEWDEALDDWWWPTDTKPAWHPNQIAPERHQIDNVIRSLDGATPDTWQRTTLGLAAGECYASAGGGYARVALVDAVESVMPDTAVLHSKPTPTGHHIFGWGTPDDGWVGVLMGVEEKKPTTNGEAP